MEPIISIDALTVVHRPAMRFRIKRSGVHWWPTRNYVLVFLFGLALAVLAPRMSAQPESITSDRLQRHVRYLASDELEGRAAGSPGNDKAAEYIVYHMQHAGLRPGINDTSYLQRFEFISNVKLGMANALSITVNGKSVYPKELQVNEEFRPFGFSSSATVTAPLVFVGYGISAPDEKYDDYTGIDVAGKIVLALRFTPEGSSPHAALSRFSSFRNKARVARERGAVAMMIVTGPADSDDDVLPKLTFDQVHASAGLPSIAVKRHIIDAILEASGRPSLKVLQDSINARKQPLSFDLHATSVSVTTDVVNVVSHSANIVGYLEGTDPMMKSQYVIVGAHFDHLGYGGEGSGSLQPDVRAIHNGADDNASGTAALLEIMGAFATNRTSLTRSLVFIGFSAEELGTLGSTYYVNNPVFPLEQTIAMVNMDMVGRLDGNTLSVHGTGTSPQWEPLLQKHNSDSVFTLKLIKDGFGPSDHAPFYGKDIPVLFFFTGTHTDYHKPSDDWDKLNYPGLESVARFVYALVRDIGTMDPRPRFARTQSVSQMGGGDSRGFSVTLGIVPDYTEGSQGMKIGGLRPGGPAEKCGLKSGDVIVKMAGKKVLSIYDYMGILGELKAGEVVDVEALRDGQVMTFTATMERRQ